MSSSVPVRLLRPVNLLNSKWLNAEDGSMALVPSTSSRLFLSFSFSFSLTAPPVVPNPEAQRHCSISVTFDGPGLKQICIPLVDFKHCLNNDASQRQVNEACSGLAMTDLKISLIRGRFYLCTSLLLWLPGRVCMCVRFSFPSPLFVVFPPLIFPVSSFFFALFSQPCSSLVPLSRYSLVSEA